MNSRTIGPQWFSAPHDFIFIGSFLRGGRFCKNFEPLWTIILPRLQSFSLFQFASVENTRAKRKRVNTFFAYLAENNAARWMLSKQMHNDITCVSQILLSGLKVKSTE
jgi:hypothetical protein